MRNHSRLGLSLGVGLVASAGVFVLSSSQALAVSAAVGYAGGVYLLSDTLGTDPSQLEKFPFVTSRRFLLITVLMSVLIVSMVDGIESSRPMTYRIAIYAVLMGSWLFFAGYGAVFRTESRPGSRDEPRGKQAIDDYQRKRRDQ